MFVVLHQDRHIDPQISLFTDKDKAIAEARRLAEVNCRHVSDIEEETYNHFIFYLSYTGESDGVGVQEIEVNE